MMKAGRKLAKQYPLKAEVAAMGEPIAPNRDPAFKQMLQAEALADLLEGILAHAQPIEEAEDVAVPADAVGPATVETVQVVKSPVKEEPEPETEPKRKAKLIEETKPIGATRGSKK